MRSSDCADAQTGLCLCCSQSTKVSVSHVYAHMMLGPRLPSLRLAIHCTTVQMTSNVRVEGSMFVLSKYNFVIKSKLATIVDV